jgi:type II secretory pathway component GspD/PulD (secretin)
MLFIKNGRKTMKNFKKLLLIPMLVVSFTANLHPMQKNSTEIANIYVNFENTPLSNVIGFFVYLKGGINITLSNFKNLKNLLNKKVSWAISKPLTYKQAWQRFVLLLDLHNLKVIDSDDGTCKITPKKENPSIKTPYEWEDLPIFYKGENKPKNLFPRLHQTKTQFEFITFPPSFITPSFDKDSIVEYKRAQSNNKSKNPIAKKDCITIAMEYLKADLEDLAPHSSK